MSAAAPPIRRTPMAPRRALPRPARAPWHAAGVRRRALLLALIAAQTALAAYFMAGVLPYNGERPLEAAILVVFTVLFAWVSAGFWTALAGFGVLLAGERHGPKRAHAGDGPIDPAARTAIVMPICNEDVQRVFAGLRATIRSLQRTGRGEHFDFFVLSDTSDPDTRVAESYAWRQLREELGAGARLFYRWRRHRLKKKAGNVADFCRRWGREYRYMVVLDADSVMSGECLVALVRLMEADPRAGIIQTAPRAAGRETLYARVQQFAGSVYGPLFTAGMHYWQLGEAHYFGHNAILRVAPFIEHCAIAGDILSHDFVEAALMRRAGWGVWVAYDLPGSYEEVPPSLLEELSRDRRWCRGNLMNGRFIGAPGVHPAHRAVFATGILAYVASPLWLAFLLLSTTLLAEHVLVPPSYFVQPRQLFPVWPEWNLAWAVGLLGATAVLLFVPKVLAVALAAARGAGRYGGALRLAAGATLEIVLSALLAPVRMLFHTQFVLSALTGIALDWRSPARGDAETPWRYAVRRHGGHTLAGLAWLALVYALDPAFLRWLLPVAGALVVAIPLSVLTSRVSLGRRLRAAGLFTIPEEGAAPAELAEVQASLRRRRWHPGFVEAVADSRTHALMRSLRPARAGRPRHAALVARACREGPFALSAAERLRLLADPVALAHLRREVWAWPRPAAKSGSEPDFQFGVRARFQQA